MTKLLFIEGIPGSGKSTTAELLNNALVASGVDATWYREENKEHPVHPREIRNHKHRNTYPTLCLESWRDFVKKESASNTLHIMEGSAFQSTVRHMMEYERKNIMEYFNEFIKAVAPMNPALIYLRPTNALELSRLISKQRGKKWTTLVSEYETNVPYSVTNNLVGIEGMHVFWQKYAELCDTLFSAWIGDKDIIKFKPGEWESHLSNALLFTTPLIAEN